MAREDDPITRAFIGHAMKVHSLVGPGLDEKIYHQELADALTAGGVQHFYKLRRDLVYRGIVADTFEPDFVVQNHFIPELKCLRGEFAGEHLVQIFCYCKFWRLRTSLLVDFGKQSLQWKRLVYPSRSASLRDLVPETPKSQSVGLPESAGNHEHTSPPISPFRRCGVAALSRHRAATARRDP